MGISSLNGQNIPINNLSITWRIRKKTKRRWLRTSRSPLMLLRFTQEADAPFIAEENDCGRSSSRRLSKGHKKSHSFYFTSLYFRENWSGEIRFIKRMQKNVEFRNIYLYSLFWCTANERSILSFRKI